MQLCIDIDGVIADVVSELDFLALRDGHDLYDYSGSFDKRNWENTSWVNDMMQTEVFWRNLRPYNDAWYAINQWFMGGIDITFVTARFSKWREVTEQWLEDWEIMYHDVIFAESGEKAEVINELQNNVELGEVVFMIEDNPLEVTAINEYGLYGQLITRDHNVKWNLPDAWWLDRPTSTERASLRSGSFQELSNKIGMFT